MDESVFTGLTKPEAAVLFTCWVVAYVSMWAATNKRPGPEGAFVAFLIGSIVGVLAYTTFLGLL